MEKIIVKKENARERIDKFLLIRAGNSSRSRLQKLIKEGSITVNSKAVPPHYFLKENDLIAMRKIEDEKKKAVNEASEAEKKSRSAKREARIPIISEAEDYLVINKPSGISVHGAPHMREATLIDLLLEKYPEIAKIGYDPDRPGIVHRLDKDVSGLLVVAKTQAAFDSLAGQFKNRLIDKKYIALAYGKMEKRDGLIDFPIERSARGFKMAARSKGQGGKRAVTEFRLIKNFINYSLLEIRIITGRTHQIRAHLSAFGHPIVGDNLYTTAKYKGKNKELGLGRIFLVAIELGFADLCGTRKKFNIDLPIELKNLLKIIK